MQTDLPPIAAGPPPPDPNPEILGRLLLLAAGAVLLGVLAHQTQRNVRRVVDALTDPRVEQIARPIARVVPPSLAELRRRAREQARPHLDRADAECRAAVARQLHDLDRFFAEATRRTPRFADQVLGWDGAWRLVSDRLHPGQHAHATFVRQRFGETLFTPEQLDGRVRQAVANYLEAVQEIEGQMLVQVRHDLADLPTTLPLVTLDQTMIQKTLAQAVARATEQAQTGLRDDVTRELVALVVGETLAQVVVRAGVSAGLLGTGAASAAATFGTGLALGLVADQFVRQVWDSRGELVRTLDRQLATLRGLVIEGTDRAPGLRQRLEALDSARAARRRAAVRELIDMEGDGP
jgi:hypothetical protein